jgi:two-component system, OmpR family, sensor histidine kinase TctE
VIELAQIVAGWPFALSMAAAVAVQGLREGRRRCALNEALHELRRPLQAVALASGPQLEGRAWGESPIDLAAAALERLDREINGGPIPPVWSRVDGHSLVRTAVSRWTARATLADASLSLRWNAADATVRGDRCALGQALDNLILNAIEHGGSTIVVTARLREDRLRIAVVDSGRARLPRSRRNHAFEAATRLSGRVRHGHGLAVVQRIAAAHDGDFALRRSESGSLAVLELPLTEVDEGRESP